MDSEAEMIAVSKAAQLAFTEAALNKTFYANDIRGDSVLYILPTEGDASDFSASRFDPALELSPHLHALYTDVKNVGHKRAGAANLFVRGSRSKSKLKSLPVAFVVCDELDEMDQDNIASVIQRMAGQPSHQCLKLANPTIEGYGINKDFKLSNQKEFFFKCPHCSRLTSLIFPDCLIITADEPTDPRIRDSHLICKECKGVLKHEEKILWLTGGIWVPAFVDRLIDGYTISQLYSFTKRPDEIAAQAIRAQYDQTEEQDLYNNTIGTVHSVAGARVTDMDLEECLKLSTFTMAESRTNGHSLITMGIDVGKWIHYEIDEWSVKVGTGPDLNSSATPRVLKVGKVTEFEQLYTIIAQLRPNFIVCDANPERRKALEFCRSLPNCRLCIYGNAVSGKETEDTDGNDLLVKVDRTAWLDLSLGRFRSKRILIPRDIPEEYKKHIKALVRVPKKTKDSTNPNIVEYINTDDDHFGHTRNYCEIALKLALGAGSHENL